MHGGRDKTVELLLSKAANINAEGTPYSNALHAASAKGHDKIAEVLRSEGTDTNREYGDALLAASAGGHDKVVELLLSKDVDVN